MSTVRQTFHDMGNWLNKISLAAIVTKESLEDDKIPYMPPAEMKILLGKAVKNLAQVEQYVLGAAKLLEEIKQPMYDKLGSETSIAPKSKKL